MNEANQATEYDLDQSMRIAPPIEQSSIDKQIEALSRNTTVPHCSDCAVSLGESSFKAEKACAGMNEDADMACSSAVKVCQSNMYKDGCGSMISSTKECWLEDAREKQPHDTQFQLQSIFLSDSSPNMTSSFKYALETIIWIVLHATVLSIIPTVFITALLGSVWFFDISFQNILHFYLSFNLFFVSSIYVMIMQLFVHMFGKAAIAPLIPRIALPSYALHISLLPIRIMIDYIYLSYTYFGVFILHFYLLVRKVRKRTIESGNIGQKRYFTLATDGTPLALFKGFVALVITYYLSAFYLTPYFMGSGFMLKMCGRVFLLPFFFNILDTYQNSHLIHKSEEFMRYRLVIGNMMNFVTLAILRFMVADSTDLVDTITMALCSGASEVFLSKSFVPRNTYMMRTVEYVKMRMFSSHLDRRLDNENQGSPYGNEGVNQSPNVQIKSFEWSLEGMRALIRSLNQKDKATDALLNYRRNRVYFVFVCQIQFIFYAPLIHFLCQPINRYINLEVTQTFSQMMTSIAIQLRIELVSQFVSECLENYLYGLELPVERFLKMYARISFLTINALISLSMVYLVFLQFWSYTAD